MSTIIQHISTQISSHIFTFFFHFLQDFMDSLQSSTDSSNNSLRDFNIDSFTIFFLQISSEIPCTPPWNSTREISPEMPLRILSTFFQIHSCKAGSRFLFRNLVSVSTHGPKKSPFLTEGYPRICSKIPPESPLEMLLAYRAGSKYLFRDSILIQVSKKIIFRRSPKWYLQSHFTHPISKLYKFQRNLQRLLRNHFTGSS